VSAGSAQRAGRGAAGRGVEAGAQETAGTRVKAAESKVRRAAKAAAAAAAAGRVERHPAARQMSRLVGSSCAAGFDRYWRSLGRH
jgi:hypothetical protein